MVVLYVSTEHKHTESLHLYFILSCEDAVVKVWLGLGTKTTYLGTGKDQVLAGNTCFGRQIHSTVAHRPTSRCQRAFEALVVVVCPAQ